jgi:endo-1,4-beta-D-glucanase Y
MNPWLIVLLSLLLVTTACTKEPLSATAPPPPVEAKLWEGLRVLHYEGYPNNFNGAVWRPDNTTTSETVSYFAMLECGAGNTTHCDKILTWADQNLWQNDGFAWYYKRGAGLTKGKDSATDGDLPLVWSAMRAYQRTGDPKYQALYEKWTPGILSGAACEYGNKTVIASGSGIGRWNGCSSFNGVYAAYVLLPITMDLAAYDSRWNNFHQGGIEQLNALYGTGLPGRCAGYNTTKTDWTKCELNPNYHDYFDAQRAQFWAGSYCKRVAWQGELCQKQLALTNRLVAPDFGVSNSGYEMNTAARGPVQFNEFSAALWSTNINGTGRNAIPSIEAKWCGKGFYGTGCNLDSFKDVLILIAMVEQRGGFFGNATIPPPIVPPPVTNCSAVLENATIMLRLANETIHNLTIENDRLRTALREVESVSSTALQE